MTPIASRRPGTTLIEMLMTLALLAIIASVATIAARRTDPPRNDDPAHMLAESLRVAVAQSRSASLVIATDSGPLLATAHADGSIIADSAFHVDRLTGRLVHAH